MHIRRETSLARRIKPPADTSRFQRMETSGVEYRRDGSTEDRNENDRKFVEL